jgi:hypothetical protein
VALRRGIEERRASEEKKGRQEEVLRRGTGDTEERQGAKKRH